jgi:hypothetical protein
MAKSLLAQYERLNYDGGKYRVIEHNINPKSRDFVVSGNMYLDHYFPKGPPVK